MRLGFAWIYFLRQTIEIVFLSFWKIVPLFILKEILNLMVQSFTVWIINLPRSRRACVFQLYVSTTSYQRFVKLLSIRFPFRVSLVNFKCASNQTCKWSSFVPFKTREIRVCNPTEIIYYSFYHCVTCNVY